MLLEALQNSVTWEIYRTSSQVDLKIALPEIFLVSSFEVRECEFDFDIAKMRGCS